MSQTYLRQPKPSEYKQPQRFQNRYQLNSASSDSFSKKGKQYKTELKGATYRSLSNSKSTFRSLRQITSYRDYSTNSLRQEMDDSFERQVIRQTVPEKDRKQVLNLQARLTIASKKARKLQQALEDRQREKNQLESQMKKQQVEMRAKTKEYEAKLQRTKEQIYKYQCENEKIVAQIISTSKQKDQLTKVQIKAEESDKGICELRKSSKDLEEQINYLTFQNQELTRELTEAKNRFDLLAQTSSEFMRRTKEIVGNNKELQFMLKSVIE